MSLIERQSGGGDYRRTSGPPFFITSSRNARGSSQLVQVPESYITTGVLQLQSHRRSRYHAAESSELPTMLCIPFLSLGLAVPLAMANYVHLQSANPPVLRTTQQVFSLCEEQGDYCGGGLAFASRDGKFTFAGTVKEGKILKWDSMSSSKFGENGGFQVRFANQPGGKRSYCEQGNSLSEPLDIRF